MISEVSPLPQMYAHHYLGAPIPVSATVSRLLLDREADPSHAPPATYITQVPVLRALLGRGQDVSIHRAPRLVGYHHRVGQQR